MSRVKEIAFVVFVVLAIAAIIGINAFNMIQDIQEAKESQRSAVEEAIGKARAEFEREAVANGAGEFVITNPKTGATEFRWKERQ